MDVDRLTANGVDFALLSAGPADGPLALCLHGFPDSAWTWRHLLPELGAAGFRAVAPFMRGYAPTSVPADARFQTGALATDAVALREALGGGPAVIVGHDWGAYATYGAAGLAPDGWRRVVTMAVPPLAAVGETFFDFAQIKRSFYIWFFQLPIADAAVAMNDLAFIDGLWDDWTSPSYDCTEDVGHVKDCLRDAENLSAAIGYYRALFDPTTHDPALADAQAAASGAPPQPTLYLHGTADGALAAPADVANLLSPGSEVELIEGANHFLHLEQPERVNRRVVEFLTG